jgi:hypothetical protein
MRLAAAIAVVAVAFSAADYVHQRHLVVIEGANVPSPATGPTVEMTFRHRTHPSWEDPAAVLIAIGGIAVGIVAYRNPRFVEPS